MDEQFKVDVPRLVFFVDREIVPSSNPIEVWERILLEYGGDLETACRAAQCFKQSFLSKYYIHELVDINFIGSANGGENLLSHNNYTIKICPMSGHVTVTKDFVHSVVLDGDVFDIDYCVLTVTYDPHSDKEINYNWKYSLK